MVIEVQGLQGSPAVGSRRRPPHAASQTTALQTLQGEIIKNKEIGEVCREKLMNCGRYLVTRDSRTDGKKYNK